MRAKHPALSAADEACGTRRSRGTETFANIGNNDGGATARLLVVLSGAYPSAADGHALAVANLARYGAAALDTAM